MSLFWNIRLTFGPPVTRIKYHAQRCNAALGMKCINEIAKRGKAKLRKCRERKKKKNIHYCIALIGRSFHELRKLGCKRKERSLETPLKLPGCLARLAQGFEEKNLARRNGHCLQLTLRNYQRCVPDCNNKNNRKKPTLHLHEIQVFLFNYEISGVLRVCYFKMCQ